MRLAGIEPANPKGVPDFKSGAYTKFRHKRRQPHKQQGQKHIQLSNTHPITSTDLWVSTSDLCGHPRFSAVAAIPSRECVPQDGRVRSASTLHCVQLGRAYALRVLILMHYPVIQRSPPVSRTPLSQCPCLADNLIKAHHLNGTQPLRPKFPPGTPVKGA